MPPVAKGPPALPLAQHYLPMLDFFSRLFDSTGFMPRWNCGSWTSGHGWLHIVSDAAIWGAYLAIPIVIAFFALRRKRDLPFLPVFWLFGAFIFACGTGHLIEAIIFWEPVYRLSGAVKFFTAIVSWGTVLALVKVTPQALRLPGLARLNEQLHREVDERRQAEAALQCSEDRYRSLVQASSQIVWTTDPDGKVAEDSPSWRAYTGQSVEEWLGAGWLRAIHPDDRDRTAAAWRQSIATRSAYEIEYRIRRADGIYRHNLVRGVPVVASDGAIREWVGMNIDITDRKEAEEALRTREHELRTILNTLPVGVWVADDKGRIIDGNPAGQRIWAGVRCVGIDQFSEYQGWWADRKDPRFGQRIGPDDWGLARALRFGEESLGEVIEIECFDGTRKIIRNSAVPIRDDQGRVIKALAVNEDITEQRRAEQALLESEERFRKFAESDVIGIIVADIYGNVRHVNDEYCRITGYSREQFVTGRVSWKDITPVEHLRADERGIAEARERGACTPYKKEYLRPDGTRVPVLVGFALIGQAREEAVAFILDLSQQQRLEDELRDRAQELAEADRRKNEFLAMLAHELRNPLAPIATAATILQQQGPQEPNLVWAREVIQRQVDHMARMIDDLLDVSRITQGKITLRPEFVDLPTVLSRSVEAARPRLEERRQQIQLTVRAQSLLVEGDPTRLDQIFSNLINNASKYSPEGGKIDVRLEQRDGQGVVRVRDYGRGIEPAVLPHVFDLFYQADQGLARTDGGLGIGLTMVRELVMLHHGSVSACSDGPGQGAEFIVQLPVVQASHAATNDSIPQISAASEKGRRRRVLIVDDNADARATLALILEVNGHEVQMAAGGAEGLAVVQEFRPDTVLLDIGLPGMSGFEVARQMRQVPELAGLLLIAVTGYGREEDVRAAKEAGFDHHLKKPVAIDALTAILDAPQPTPLG